MELKSHSIMKELNIKRRVFIVLILILAIALFWWGYQMGKSDALSDAISDTGFKNLQ